MALTFDSVKQYANDCGYDLFINQNKSYNIAPVGVIDKDIDLNSLEEVTEFIKNGYMIFYLENNKSANK